MTVPDISTVRELAARYSNWGRFGEDDQLGTLNHVTPEAVVRAAATVRSGRVVSLGLPLDEHGPQNGGLGRFNPIHLMFRSGVDALAGTTVRDFYHGNDRHVRGTDDLIIMPLQSSTQWDGLGHMVFDEKIYNGVSADWVSSKGAVKNDITAGIDKVVGRGVLLDMPSAMGVESLDPGYPITADDLRRAERAADLEVGPGDFVFVRTGHMKARRVDGGWGDYAGGPAPGLGLEAVPWVAERRIAALATDTWGFEVQPNETPDTSQPLHIVLLVFMGLWLGEIFALEELLAACRQEGRHEFLFVGPPLNIPYAVGSPLAPVAVF